MEKCIIQLATTLSCPSLPYAHIFLLLSACYKMAMTGRLACTLGGTVVSKFSRWSWKNPLDISDLTA